MCSQEDFMKLSINKLKSNFFTWLPWAFMVVSFCATMLILCLYFRELVDYDMSNEMILADILNEEGGILTQSWWYSSEIRVFYVQFFYRPAMLLFPNNWYAARMFGQAGMMACVIACYLYLCNKNGLGLKNNGAWGAAALASPIGLFYFKYCWLGGFYAPHIILVLLPLGLALHLVHEAPRWRHILQAICLALVCFISGLGGVKELMICYLPLALTSIILLISALHKEPEKIPSKELKFFGYSSLALLSGVVGYGINTKILANIYVYETYERHWNLLSILDIFDSLSGFLSLLGWQYVENWWYTNFNIFSFNGMLGGFAVLLIAALLIAVVRLVQHWRELSFENLFAIALFLFALLVQSGTFAYTTGNGRVTSYIWLPILPFVFVILQVACETEHFNFRYSKKIVSLFLLFCIAGTGLSSVKTFLTFQPSSVPTLRPVCDWLVENGYENGYITFHDICYGNIMTEWSSGKIEMWIMTDDNFTEPSRILQKSSHVNPPEGEIFVLDTPNTEDDYFSYMKNAEIVYQDENGYTVFAYDSYDELAADIIARDSIE